MSKKITAAQDMGRVGVLMGGMTERTVSIAGGESILSALEALGVSHQAVLVEEDLITPLQQARIDRVFNILHGGQGEGGIAQAVMTSLHLPFTDSDILASSLALDKERTKWLWTSLGLPTPSYLRLTPDYDPCTIIEKLGLPVVIKPIYGGSSLGMSIAQTSAELEAAIKLAYQYENTVMAEQYIDGQVLTIGILGNKTLPVIHIETPAESFYDYHHKYETTETLYHCPAAIDVQTTEVVQRLAVDAFVALGARNWGRIDMMLDADNKPWLLELNTVPGMTSHSLMPKAAAAIGISYKQLVWDILQLTMSP